MTKVLLAVDAGTSRIKAVAFSMTGEQRAMSTQPVETVHPQPGHVEQDMTQVRRQMETAIQTVLNRLPETAHPQGLAITGQGDGLWAIDADGTPVRNAILWSDSRAADLLATWGEDGTREAIVDQCGSAPYPGMSFPLLVWLAGEHPREFARIDTLLSCKDWLAYTLTGSRSIDHSEATVPYLDQRTEHYNTHLFTEVGLPEASAVLPELSAPTDIVGQVTPAAADRTGLPEGLPVVSGPFDVPAAAIGSGAVTDGTGAVTLGTSLTQQVLTTGPTPDTNGIQMALGIEDRWTVAIGSNAGTPSLEWVADTIADDVAVDELESIAKRAPAGSEGLMYHPYLSATGERGPFVDPAARGQLIGATPAHDTAHVVRAVYEGLSYAVRDCLDHLPAAVDTVVVSGGGTDSALWCQLLADCLNKPVVVPATDAAGAKGAAMVLAVAQDAYESLATAASQMRTHERRYTPDPATAETYESLYQAFVDIRKQLPPIWDRRRQAYEAIDEENSV